MGEGSQKLETSIYKIGGETIMYCMVSIINSTILCV